MCVLMHKEKKRKKFERELVSWKERGNKAEEDEAFHGCMRKAQCRDVLMLHI